METASLLNKYSDVLADIDDNKIEDPDFRETIRGRTEILEPRRLDGVVEEMVKELLQYVDNYRDTYKSESDCSVGERGVLIEKMRSAIEKVDLSLSVDADEFYKMYYEYMGLKDCTCKTCTVCGSRNPVENLKDAVDFFEVLDVSDEQADVFKGLLYNADGVEDEAGRLAQKCFHIEEVCGKLFHFLNFDEEEYQKVSEEYDGDNPTQDPRFSLVQAEKLKKLPSCEKCLLL